MKLFIHGLFACGWLTAAVLLAGCGSPSQGWDNIKPSAAATPVNGASVARFQIGETVIVTFSGSPAIIEPHEEPIKENGTITLPLIGSVSAVGRTAGELQNEIHNGYVPKYYVRLTVTVKSSSDRVFYVGGEVKGGGRQQYIGDTTVTKAIQSAGGLTDFANHGKVWLTRATTGQRIRVNYDDAIQDQSKDPPVYPGDQINVEKRLF
jgi:polysaccharide export outer membrane protein